MAADVLMLNSLPSGALTTDSMAAGFQTDRIRYLKVSAEEVQPSDHTVAGEFIAPGALYGA